MMIRIDKTVINIKYLYYAKIIRSGSEYAIEFLFQSGDHIIAGDFSDLDSANKQLEKIIYFSSLPEAK